MLALVFLVLTCVVAVQTKPAQDTFVPFLTTQRTSRIAASSSSSSPAIGSSSSSGSRTGSSGGNWFTRNILAPLTGAPRVPEHTVTDYYFFQLATLTDGSGQYLGAFHQWWVVSELQDAAALEKKDGSAAVAAGGKEANLMEAKAEAKKQEAVQLKIRKDHAGAARAYMESAKLYEKGGSSFNLMEAAGAYEDASKAFQMAKQNKQSLQCLENAARLFRTNDRSGSTRAAKIYQQMGDMHNAQQEPFTAIEKYREAAELFQSERDGRYLQASIRLAQTHLTMGIAADYKAAYDLYSTVIIPESLSQELLAYSARDYIVTAIFAHFAAIADSKGFGQDCWMNLEQDLARFEDLSRDFAVSTQCKALRSLSRAREERDPDGYQRACQELDRVVSSRGMEDWQVRVLLEEKRKMESGEEDLL